MNGARQVDNDTTTASVVHVEWKLETPTEQDDEELQEYIAPTVQGDDKEQVKTILTALYLLGIFHWRQLANADAAEIRQAMNISADQVECWNGSC